MAPKTTIRPEVGPLDTPAAAALRAQWAVEPAFDPRLSVIDLYDWLEDAEALATREGRKIQPEVLKAWDGALARAKGERD